MNKNLIDRYNKDIKGVLNCFDRLIFFGSFRPIGYADAMSKHLYFNKVKMVDYVNGYANELRLKMIAKVESVAQEEGMKPINVTYKDRKEKVVEQIIETRGRRNGLVCILKSMESCRCYKPYKNHKTGYLELRFAPGKCMHYYMYWIDEDYGLCYLRIPTWAPFRLQFYCNGHDWLERRMKTEGIRYRKADNCFVHISDFEKAQQLVYEFKAQDLHERLNQMAKRFVGVYDQFGHDIQWSINQAEWATDIVFKNERVLPDLYKQIVRTAVLEVKCPDIYGFMGKRLIKTSKLDVESRLQTLVQGTRIKHSLGSTSLKMYDKQNCVLRIEATTNDVSTFKCYRKVESRLNEDRVPTWSPIRKTIYSLGVLAEAMNACNQRYLKFISSFVDRTNERHKLQKVTSSVRDEKNRSYRGINFFQEHDFLFLQAILQGQHQIQGIRNRSIQAYLPGWSAGKIGRVLRRFKVIGLLKKIKGTVKYYLTALGRDVLIAALQLKNRIVMPAFNST